MQKENKHYTVSLLKFRYGFFIDLKAILQTILQKNKLDRLGILYFLKNKRKHRSAENITQELKTRLHAIAYIKNLKKTLL